MTRHDDDVQLDQKYVLVFDICSSTVILEDLVRSESQKRWRDLLIDLKSFLRNEQTKHQFEIYKFIGDGWILLFDKDFSPADLFDLLKRLSEVYGHAFIRHIKGVLSVKIHSIGLTFGLELGTLIRFEINENTEYLGRAINVAARLQAAVKHDTLNPEGQVLMSMRVYDKMKREIRNAYRIRRVTRNLNNVAGGESYIAMKIDLFKTPEEIFTVAPA